MTGLSVIFVGKACGISAAAPSLQDLTGALTYVGEDCEPRAEEVDSHNENSSLETCLIQKRLSSYRTARH